MDLVDLMQEKKFLGQEFLTWVWYQSEINSGLIDLPGYGAVEVWFENRLALESGSGEYKQAVTCQGKDLDLAEARTALKEGKKVSQARIRLNSDGREWRFNIKAEGLDLGSVRLPKTMEPDEEEEAGLAGRLLDRSGLIQELIVITDAMFGKFLGIRLTGAWEEREQPAIRRWLKENNY